MLEMYLFINPLGAVCYQAEQDILTLVARSDKQINFRFIPLLTLKTVTSVMKTRHIPLGDLEQRNKLAKELYQAALDCKAVVDRQLQL